jgi:DNA-binding cell septation regulator SpoVG
MPISSVKIWPLKKDHPKIKANCRIVIDEKFSISAAIRQGEKGLYVSLPGHYGERNGEREWFDDVACVSKEARKELTETVLKAYNEEIGNGPTNQGEAPGPTAQTKQQIPFG